MKNLVILFAFIMTIGCYDDSETPAILNCNYQMEDLNGKPPILIIGDSISFGYTPHIDDYFNDYQVIHNNCNARNSRHSVSNIESWVNHAEIWEVCMVNQGLWDLITIGGYYTTEDEYVSNIIYEINILKTRCKKIIAPNTTRIPENALYFDANSLNSRNEIYKSTMESLNVEVCDLFAVSETITDLHLNAELKNDVHYTNEGYEILANKIIECIGI